MVTKCARAYIVSGALIGMTVPSSQPLSQGHAKSPEIRNVEKPPRVLQKNRCPVIPVGHEFTTPVARIEGETTSCTLQANQVASWAPATASPLSTAQPTTVMLAGPSQRNRTLSSSRRRHLGSF